MEAYVLGEPEMVGIHSVVVHDERVVHEVREVGGNGEVAEGHHLFGGVDDDWGIDAGPVLFRFLLQWQEMHEASVSKEPARRQTAGIQLLIFWKRSKAFFSQKIYPFYLLLCLCYKKIRLNKVGYLNKWMVHANFNTKGLMKLCELNTNFVSSKPLHN